MRTGGDTFAWWGLLGLVIFGLGVGILVLDLEAWNAVWYLPAWYGYLLCLDALLFTIQGHSFLSHRRRELGAMLFWSVPFWYLFELYNLVLKNWYYVFVLRTDWVQQAVGFLAFATVLPACFGHAELLEALGWLREIRCRPLLVRRRQRAVLLLLGIASLAAPLLWPRYAFWLVWGATLWIPELINERAGAPSLLRDLGAGRCGRLLRLFVGGLLAGIVWESLNYWARCKWIYTVPGFEEHKLFEMPIAGFLGFPLLALSGSAFYALLSRAVRGGRHWEVRGRQGKPIPRFRYAVSVTVAVAVSLTGSRLALDHSVESRRPLLRELSGLGASEVASLRRAGIPTPERLQRAVTVEGLDAVAARTGLELSVLDEAQRHAALALHKGMGAAAAGLLREAGVPTVAALARTDIDELLARLRPTANQQVRGEPRTAVVRVWKRAATAGGRSRR